MSQHDILASMASLYTAAGSTRFSTILADPPWRFKHRRMKGAPEHKRLGGYATMSLQEVITVFDRNLAAANSHLYLWVPVSLVTNGLLVLEQWGFKYKTALVWSKVTKAGKPDRRGQGYYFRNTAELLLFGVRGSLITLPPGRSQANLVATVKREHSRKPDEFYGVIERCSPGPRLEMFARHKRAGWTQWGNQL